MAESFVIVRFCAKDDAFPYFIAAKNKQEAAVTAEAMGIDIDPEKTVTLTRAQAEQESLKLLDVAINAVVQRGDTFLLESPVSAVKT